MKEFFRKINSSKKYFLLGLLILAVVVIVLPRLVNAADSSEVTVGGVVVSTVKTLAASPILLALGVISVLVIGVIGAINMIVISFLVNIVQYNNFINEPSIISAWVIVRDLCNMFFILILLVVAFATILRIESYQWKKILPKLLIMAVLINFSRTICGLIIDASQVVMLTFTNAFGSGGNFVDMTQMAKYFTGVTFGDFGTDNFSVLNVVIGMLIGIMFLIISGIVLVVAMSVFFMRIVMLWILLVLSPFAFLAAAFPAGQKYASQWWSEFVRYILNGPVLAFFIWMALITSQQKVAFFTQGDAAASLAKQCFGSSQIMCMETFMPFILSIGMLLGGLMITQQIGGVGSSIAGKGLDWAKRAPKLMGGGAMFAGGWLGRKIKSGAVSGLLATKTVDKEGNVSWKGRAPGLGGIASALYGLEIRPTKIIEGIKEGIKSQAEKEEMQATGASAISLRRGGIGGMIKGLGVSRDLTESILGPGGILWHKGFNRVFQATLKGGPKGVAKTEEEIAGLRANRGVTRAEYDEVKKQYDEKGKARSDAYAAGKKDEGDKFNEEFIALGKKLLPMRSKIVDKGERDKQDADIEKLEKKLSLRKPIQTFYADRAREELISKARQTMGDNDNEDALVEMFNDALANGNKEVAQAVMLHAAKVGHLNEVIQSYKSKRDLKDERGNLLVKKGGALPQGGYGLHEVVKQALIEDLGMDEHTALATQSEASTLAKSIRHMNLAESVGTKNGFLIQRKIEGPGGQMDRARGEARKVDAEKFIRDYNRLGWGDEFMDASGGRDFKLNALGLDNFTELANIISKEIGPSGRMNKNAAMNIAGDAETLMNWAEELENKGMKYYDAKSDKADKMESYVELAKNLIKFGNNVRQAQGKTEVSEGIKELQTKVLNKQTRPT